MESVKLEKGWLACQMQEVREEVKQWPEILWPLRRLNESLVHDSTKLLALRGLRFALEQKYAKQLADIDKQIEAEERR